jgi:DNA-directed RNA polymerase specialized sigma24 family protein
VTPSFFTSAYERGFRSTVQLLLAKGLRLTDAEEYAQAAWVKGWEARKQLRDPERVVPWVNTIALHNMHSQSRRDRRFEQLEESANVKVAAPTVLEKIEAQQLLAQCSDLNRSLLVDRYARGMDTAEIALRHGLSSVNTRVRIHRSRQALRDWAMDATPAVAAA